MNPSNRTIEEKLAIIQELRNNKKKQTNEKQEQTEEASHFMTFLVVRLVICVLIFGIIAFIGSKNPAIMQYINAMITTEENGNLIDFMSPFTYTLQENDESAQDTDSNAPSEE